MVWETFSNRYVIVRNYCFFKWGTRKLWVRSSTTWNNWTSWISQSLTNNYLLGHPWHQRSQRWRLWQIRLQSLKRSWWWYLMDFTGETTHLFLRSFIDSVFHSHNDSHFCSSYWSHPLTKYFFEIACMMDKKKRNSLLQRPKNNSKWKLKYRICLYIP